ncbi:hypothetical protein LCGC14_0798540 [marine sediment metagenome]|uniref:Uncharacterized protein n=1 Tax=marine sediment metagenome TaxID=412755 RepID=A0A0F9SAB4_9ZZZZ
MAKVLPKDMSWPTQKQWERDFTKGLKASSAGVTTSPAISDMVSVLGKVIERQTGKPLGAFVTSKVADLVALTANEFASGTLKMPASIVKEIGAVAGAVAGMIPIIAEAVEIGIGVLEEAEEVQQGRLRQRTQRMLDYCKARYVTPKPTGPDGTTTPADLFRPVFEALQQPKRLVGYAALQHAEYVYPVTAAAMFCALCGDLSPLGWNTDKRKRWIPPPPGMTSAAGAKVSEYFVTKRPGKPGYRWFLRIVRKKQNNAKLGIPWKVRKRMATIIEGMLSSVRPYTLEAVAPVGDQGRTLFPVLCDIILHEHRAGHWNQEMLRSLQRSQIKCYGVTNYQTGATISPVIDLSTDFLALINAWKNTIEVASADYGPAHKVYLTGTSKLVGFRKKITVGPSPSKGKAVAVAAGAAALATAAIVAAKAAGRL